MSRISGCRGSRICLARRLKTVPEPGSRLRQRPFVGLTSIVVLVLKAGGPSSPKGLPVVAAVNGSTTGRSHSGETTAASGDVASFSKEGLQSMKIAKEQSVEPKTQASLDSPPEVSVVPHEAVVSTAASVTPNVEVSS